jgi:hypothetical protein
MIKNNIAVFVCVVWGLGMLSLFTRSSKIVREQTSLQAESHPLQVGGMITGGLTPVDTQRSDVVNATLAAVGIVNSQSNKPHSMQVVSIMSSSVQVVSGAMYRMRIQAGESECPNDEATASKTVAECPVPADKVHVFKVEVWSRPWMSPPYKLMRFEQEHQLPTEHQSQSQSQSQAQEVTIVPIGPLPLPMVGPYFCNCPVAYFHERVHEPFRPVIWPCDKDTYDKIMNGTTCDYYRKQPPRHKNRGSVSSEERLSSK